MENNKLEVVKERIKNIFVSRFEFNFDTFGEEQLFNKSLLSEEIGLLPRQLLYVFFDIEKEFGIQIPQECVANGEFDSINNIVNIVLKELN
ncbi:peptide maturation system acyl carrier-related protein [Ruminiclostridium cellobioparum]|uniref:peptide maturation system acyl carrier-related protein n=1 Tax=Ruminiclostridium cellobioparum TaxID=29355 RepID=UPI0028AE1FA7|nr:peptide maturation system acyl carrier-related protein [Ruminiclostridium cellobioparum]